MANIQDYRDEIESLEWDKRGLEDENYDLNKQLSKVERQRDRLLKVLQTLRKERVIQMEDPELRNELLQVETELGIPPESAVELLRNIQRMVQNGTIFDASMADYVEGLEVLPEWITPEQARDLDKIFNRHLPTKDAVAFLAHFETYMAEQFGV